MRILKIKVVRELVIPVLLLVSISIFFYYCALIKYLSLLYVPSYGGLDFILLAIYTLDKLIALILSVCFFIGGVKLFKFFYSGK